MDEEQDRDDDVPQTGYGAADDEADEDTPEQEQQQSAHEREGLEGWVGREQDDGRTR